MAIFSSDIVTSAISASIADTAVDVFVYDTSKDSDGGAWRKRTQHTSWYNEGAGTYRGSRKEFPAVAVIVASNADSSVTIYDGDDPDLPMWMVFYRGGDNDPFLDGSTPGATFLGNYPPTSVSAFNGIICVGAFRSSGALTNLNAGLRKFSFIEDACYATNDTNTYKLGTTFVDRNIVTMTQVTQGGAIVNVNVNDLVMTVLPNAPIGDTTGLPVPTIAVATDGGVSVIKDDGSVINATGGGAYAFSKAITITEENYLWWLGDSYLTNDVLRDSWVVSLDNFPSSDFTWNNSTDGMSDGSYYALTTGNEAGEIKIGSVNTWAWNKQERNALGGPSGLAIHKPNIGSENNSLIAAITSDYNTGWMHGAIKGAFLSDTDTTNVTGEKVDLTNGSTEAGATGNFSSITSNQLVAGSTTDSIGRYNTGTTLVTGKQYYATLTISNYSGSDTLGVSTGGGIDGTFRYNANGTYTRYITGASGEIQIFYRSSNSATIGLTIKEVDPDRSVNNKGLQVFGTVTKSAVATGADLVAYSGFSNSNHLIQPYISNMDFGTADFSVTWWQKIDGNITGSQYVYDRQGSSGNRHAVIYYATNNGRMSLYTSDGASSEILYDGINVYANQWTCYTQTRHSSGLMEIYINGELKTSNTYPARNLTNTSAELFIGLRHSLTDAASEGNFCLLRFSESVPSAEQVKKMYEDEKVLFQENAKATLYGSSNAVTALAYDEVTDQLHVGTSAGRSDFQGLRRINNTTDPVTTAISAHDSLIIEQ